MIKKLDWHIKSKKHITSQVKFFTNQKQYNNVDFHNSNHPLFVLWFYFGTHFCHAVSCCRWYKPWKVQSLPPTFDSGLFFRCEYAYRYYPWSWYCMETCGVVEYSKLSYDSQRLEKQSLRKAIIDTFELRWLEMICLWSVAVIIDLTFTFIAAKRTFIRMLII